MKLNINIIPSNTRESLGLKGTRLTKVNGYTKEQDLMK